MKIILFIFLLTSICFGQLINETFSDFTLPTDANTVSNHVLDGTYQTAPDSIQEDLTTNNNDLAADGVGWTSMLNAYSSLGGTSPIYSGGNFLTFNGTDEFLRRDAGLSATPNSFTIEFWMKSAESGGGRIINYMRDGNREDGFEVFEGSGRISIYVVADGGGAVSLLPVPAAENPFDDAWHYIAITYVFNDATGCIGYVDGVPVDTVGDTGLTAPLFAVGNEYFIGNGFNEALEFDGDIALVRFSDVIRTPQEIREGYHLANGWYSKNGNVYRENLTTWNQGFYDSDTAYFPVSDSTISGGVWRLSVNAKSGIDGSTIKAWIGKSNEIKGTAWETTLISAASDFTFDFGEFNTSSDSLFYTVSAVDTNYIDDVQVNFVSEENKYSGYKEYTGKYGGY